MTTSLSHSHSDKSLQAFQWAPQPQAEALIAELVGQFLVRSQRGKDLARRLLDEAGVRFGDVVDYITVPKSLQLRQRLADCGFEPDPGAGIKDVFCHHGGLFPRVRLSGQEGVTVAMRVEFVADFLVAKRIEAPIEGKPYSPIRLCKLFEENSSALLVIEQHGSRNVAPVATEQRHASDMLHVLETFRMRTREFANAREGFHHARKLIDEAISQVGVNAACDLFFAAEREYWHRRNRAAQVQKARQDRLGIGWANHDHHTYRSSREHFADLMTIFERLGFVCRERFYAGAQAGWGAQILEQSEARIIIFADVDLAPQEVMVDFAHEGLAPRKELGTVGLWCALHGEAFLQAGMHHLECQFDFDALKRQLEADGGVKVMKPFTNFPYLRQAFTEGEVWPVRPECIERLLKAGQITSAQADQFRASGALGSHLENLERNEGFKGFNQTGISEIIHRTDPRKQAH